MYDKEFVGAVKKLPLVSLGEVINGVQASEVRVHYSSNKEFEKMANQLKIMSDLRVSWNAPNKQLQNSVMFTEWCSKDCLSRHCQFHVQEQTHSFNAQLMEWLLSKIISHQIILMKLYNTSAY